MKVRDMVVSLAERNEVRDFIENHHYSKSINGLRSTYCFKLEHDGKLIGAMIYGLIGMANVWRKYGEAEEDVIELRRLCCIDETPKNTESYFIGHTLRWLRKNTCIKTVVSYADPNYGHRGVIYQASNFKHLGITAKGRVIMWGDRRYHDKSIRSMFNGRPKPFALRLREALSKGEASYQKTEGKHIYIYELRKVT